MYEQLLSKKRTSRLTTSVTGNNSKTTKNKNIEHDEATNDEDDFTHLHVQPEIYMIIVVTVQYIMYSSHYS